MVKHATTPVLPVTQPAPAPVNDELAKLRAELAQTKAELEAAKTANKLGKAPSFYWNGLGINEVIRAMYLIKQDKGAINFIVCCKMGFPCSPLIVSECCAQAQRSIDVAKLSEEVRKTKKKGYLDYGKKPVATLTAEQKATIEGYFTTVPVKPA